MKLEEKVYRICRRCRHELTVVYSHNESDVRAGLRGYAPTTDGKLHGICTLCGTVYNDEVEDANREDAKNRWHRDKCDVDKTVEDVSFKAAPWMPEDRDNPSLSDVVRFVKSERRHHRR